MNDSRKPTHHSMSSLGVAVAAALACATLGVGPSAHATSAEGEAATSETTSPASAVSETVGFFSSWERDFYRNYFSDNDSCRLYGRALLADPDRYNSGLRKFDCHKHSGERNWSMDLYWLT